MVAWQVEASQDEFRGIQCAWVKPGTDDREPVAEWQFHRTFISDLFIYSASPEYCRWLWRPYIWGACGITWLMGPYRLEMAIYPAWPANIATFWLWLGTWLWYVLERRLLWPPLRFARRRGWLVISEGEAFCWRHLPRYLLDAHQSKMPPIEKEHRTYEQWLWAEMHAAIERGDTASAERFIHELRQVLPPESHASDHPD